MNVIIVDDELLARHLMREYLSKHADVHIIGECENGLQAVRAITELAPDLIFLDIHMPKMSGLEVLDVTGRKTGVIFTTAYDEYALKAFELHAVDYLLKPFSQERFDVALNQARALNALRAQPQPAPLHNNIDKLIKHTQLDRIVIRDRGQLHFIAVNKIDFIEAQDDYIMIHSEGKSILKTQALSDIESQLNPNEFIRIHRSYLINIAQLERIERLNKDSIMALLKNGKQLPISRSGYERIKPLLGLH
jgi:two-component system LytT family response regulator